MASEFFVEGLRVRAYGRPTSSKKILMIHGGPGVSIPEGIIQDYMKNTPIGLDWLMIVPDQRSMHSSPPFTLMSDIDDIECLRRHFGIGKWDIVMGRSWGASLSIIYFQLHPSKVRNVLAISPSSLLVENTDVYNCMHEKMMNRSTGALEDYERLHPAGKKMAFDDRLRRALVQAYYRKNDFFCNAGSLSRLFTCISDPEKLVVIHGDQDDLLTEMDRWIARRFYTLYTLQNHGHDDSTRVKRIVFQHLTRWAKG